MNKGFVSIGLIALIAIVTTVTAGGGYTVYKINQLEKENQRMNIALKEQESNNIQNTDSFSVQGNQINENDVSVTENEQSKSTDVEEKAIQTDKTEKNIDIPEVKTNTPSTDSTNLVATPQDSVITNNDPNVFSDGTDEKPSVEEGLNSEKKQDWSNADSIIDNLRERRGEYRDMESDYLDLLEEIKETKKSVISYSPYVNMSAAKSISDDLMDMINLQIETYEKIATQADIVAEKHNEVIDAIEARDAELYTTTLNNLAESKKPLNSFANSLITDELGKQLDEYFDALVALGIMSDD